MKSAANEESFIVITFISFFSASFAEHVNLLKVHFLDYVNLVVIVEIFVSASMCQITVCLSYFLLEWFYAVYSLVPAVLLESVSWTLAEVLI